MSIICTICWWYTPSRIYRSGRSKTVLKPPPPEEILDTPMSCMYTKQRSFQQTYLTCIPPSSSVMCHYWLPVTGVPYSITDYLLLVFPTPLLTTCYWYSLLHYWLPVTGIPYFHYWLPVTGIPYSITDYLLLVFPIPLLTTCYWYSLLHYWLPVTGIPYFHYWLPVTGIPYSITDYLTDYLLLVFPTPLLTTCYWYSPHVLLADILVLYRTCVNLLPNVEYVI